MSQHLNEDEAKLVDFLTGSCDEQQSRDIHRRLSQDAEFRRLHDELSNTFAAMDLLPEAEPPEDLTQRTIARVRSHRQTQAILAREEASRRPLRPTFRLRELAAMAAVFVILGSVMVPMVRRAQTAASIDTCAYRMGQIGAGLLTYANDNDGYLPIATSERRPWLATNEAEPASNSAALFQLIRQKHVQSPTAFQCPSVESGPLVVTAGMTDFPDAQYVSYSYQHAVGDNPVSIHNQDFAEVAGEMAILSDSNPVFEGGRFHPDRLSATASANHNHTGQNVLYLDMHVDWASDPNVGVNGNNIFLADGVREYTGFETPSSPTDSFLLPAFTNSPSREAAGGQD